METLKLIIFLGLALIAAGYAPVPKREVGFVYNGGSPHAKIKMDFFIDQMCPDSKQAWPTILRLADHYGPMKLRLRTRVFSLACFRNGFHAAKGSYIVNKLSNSTRTYAFIQKVFSQLDMLDNAATMGQSDYQVIDKLADIAASVGVDRSAVLSGFNDSSYEWTTRVAWKYAAFRKVHEAPTFMLNDVVFLGSSTWSVADWRKVIDPLLGIVEQSTAFPVGGSGRVVPAWSLWAGLISCVLFISL